MNKIEIVNLSSTQDINNSKLEQLQMYKPVYLTDEELTCGVIEYKNKRYLLNHTDKDNIINFDKKFAFHDEEDIYPSYKLNYRKINYLEFIFGFNPNKVSYSFVNNNCMDLRRGNVITEINKKKNLINDTEKKENSNVVLIIEEKNIPNIDELIKPYNVIEQITMGHRITMGRDANKIKNPVWKILNEKGEEKIIMYCETNTICILCPESYKKIIDYETLHNEGKKLTFFKMQNGYICANNKLYIHQIITGCNGNGKGTKNISVDHLDRNPLNNTMENLMIASRKDQEQNSKGIAEGTKRERKHNAKKLPEGLTQNMMRKYVVYYHEWLNPEKTKSREYFKIETHPKLEKIWIGTKSNKVTLLEKLNAVNKYVDEIN
jgi:hypothetical protein